MPIDDALAELSDGPKFPPENKISKPFSIKETKEFYIIEGVKINNQIKTVKWEKELLEKGQHNTQDKWIELTKNSIYVRLASLPTHISTIIALYENKNSNNKKQNSLVEKARKMFEADFKPGKPWTMINTRITYRANGSDIIKHDYGYNTAYERNIELTGPHGPIHDGIKQIIQALTENDDLEKIEKSIEWVSGQKPFLWRLTNKQQVTQERVVAIGSSNYQTIFHIDCDQYIGNYRPARGVDIV